jgi:tetratricopeptide (TPR) repeat protein
MALDAYSACPCGSGKKFKWCCQPIHVHIAEAFEQEVQGQHDSALRIMDLLVKDHADNPETWGRRAQLLYQHGRDAEAEESLQKALEINPDYPFGLMLKGLFRENEAEHQGALRLLRRAVDLYDPSAREALGQVHAVIAACEMKLNRPVAAYAAFKIALHCEPANEELRKDYESQFGEGSAWPQAGRRDYTFHKLIPPEAADTWQTALASAAVGKLSAAALLFQRRTEQCPEDPAGWFNRGLCLAWLGENGQAIEAFDRYVDLEANEGRAAEAWTLADVLRCGHGLEEQADYIEHWCEFQIRQPEPVVALLQGWQSRSRLLILMSDEKRFLLNGLVLQQLPPLTAELARTQVAVLGAHLLIVGDRIRLWHNGAPALADIQAELSQKLGPALSEPHKGVGPISFTDVLAEGLGFPVQAASEEEAKSRASRALQQYLEEKWIHRPLHSLGMVPPIDAVGHRVLRKKLLGSVTFLEECAATNPAFQYDFNQLRRKLGLLAGDGAAATPGSVGDIAAMGAAELASLPIQGLTEGQLELAFQTALKLDARELAGRFAEALVGRSPGSGHADRYPHYALLIQTALAKSDWGRALDLVNAGEKADCEQNEGRRRNDYELRRGQVESRRGSVEEAERVFDRLIERAPGELGFRGAAAEAMLSARHPARALRFAQAGLAKAREKNDRDSEEYFKELVAAAEKATA